MRAPNSPPQEASAQTMSARAGRTEYMRIETVLLALGIASIVAGSAYVAQEPKGHKSLPLKVFSQAKEEDFTGSSACAECHDDKVANFAKSAHNPYSQRKDLDTFHRGCESCHGPGKLHKPGEEDDQVIAYKKISAQEVSDGCLRCHGSTMKMSQWHRSEHGRNKNVSCVSCHQIHPDSENEFAGKAAQPLSIKRPEYAVAKASSQLLKADEATLCASCHRTEAAQFRQLSHHPVPEGRLICSDCHDLHPTKKNLSRREAIKEKCVVCHTEYAGPFAYEHDPVAGHTGAGCIECHKPHGSHNPDLLNSYSRGVCAQCHTEKLTNHFPGRTCWQSGCHVAIHGSNTDPRFLQP
jgi:predicted CXXCH cytochrome family protein